MVRASSVAAAILLSVAVALPLAAIPHHYVWREFYVAYTLKAGVNSTMVEIFETGFNGSMRPGWAPSNYIAPDSIPKYYSIRDNTLLEAVVYRYVNGTLVKVLSIAGQPGNGGDLMNSLSSAVSALPPANYICAIYLSIPGVGNGVTHSRRLVAAVAFVRDGGVHAVSMNVPYLYPPNPGYPVIEVLATYILKTYSPADWVTRASLAAAYPFIAIAAAALLARKSFGGRKARAACFAILVGSAALLAYVVVAEGVGPAIPAAQPWHDSVVRLGEGVTLAMGIHVKAYVGPGGTPLSQILTPYQLTALKLLSALAGGGRLAVEIVSQGLSCNATVRGATYVGHGVYLLDKGRLGSVRVAATCGRWAEVSIIVGIPVKVPGLLSTSYG